MKEADAHHPLFKLAASAPTLSAFLVLLVVRGKQGLLAFWARYLEIVRLRWYIVIFGGAGLIVAGVYAVVSGFIAVGNMLPIWSMQGILVFLFGFSYLNANKLDGQLQRLKHSLTSIPSPKVSLW